MLEFFQRTKAIKPLFDIVDRVIMLICKLFLIADIAITTISVLGRYIPFISDMSWTEEMVLLCMINMALLSSSLAIRKNSHIRMTAFDRYLPKKMLLILDLFTDLVILVFAVFMIVYGWMYSTTIGAKSTYASMPWLSSFWKYIPVFISGITIVFFEISNILNRIEAFLGKEVQKNV